MTISAAPALLIGLSARLLMDFISRSEEQTVRDFLMAGLWQGVLWCTVKNHDLSLPVAFGILVKLLIDYTFMSDMLKFATTLVGVALGAIGTDFLSSVVDKPKSDKDKRKKSHSTKEKDVPSSQSRTRSSRHAEKSSSSKPPRSRRTTSDITSVDSESELIGSKASMSPLDREVAALRARASLADSERRRFKEERKWAKAQGNIALAAQLRWQVKRYSALMKSFHREADTKLLEGSSNSRSRLQTIDEHQPMASTSYDRTERRRREGSRRPEHPVVHVDIDPSQVKSAIRVNVR
ncbi:hypothetical protein BDP27DRAFT_1315018 [Rhodocollybia butyracea]|uniref:Uncharacterized protein n=1 Tax=Rhodocollybia butyracea TaxID=206335 RepID=A0A9P5PZE8_9AGAR|nr:hypothetical protein BDP27DRAFT_1315018 [Rhodocollybia butyracea]